MSDPVSNQDLAVVTQGTAHVARTKGATDTCLDPATKTTQDFENSIPSTLLAANKTTKTKINDQPIMVRFTRIGPPSAGAVPPFVIGAKSTKPFLNYAQATKYSQDVKAEGKPIVRTDDDTKQNAWNTDGFMDGSQLAGDQVTQAEFQKLKCSMQSLVGESPPTADATAAASKAGKPAPAARPLNKRSKNATRLDYIEVLAGETVDLISTRWDATNPGAPLDPACALVSTHTDWKATRTGGGASKQEKTGSGKEFTVDGGLTGEGLALQIAGLAPTVTTTPTAKSVGTGSEDKGLVRGATEDKVSSGLSTSVDWASVLKFLVYWANPCVIRVDAMACASTETVDIRVFPKDELSCSITFGRESTETTTLSRNSKDDIRQKIYDKFFQLNRLSAFLKKIFRIANVELDVKLFVGFQLEFKMAYKHCSKALTTRSGEWRDVNFCGLSWTLTVASDPLIACSLTIPIPLVPLAVTFLTGGGGALVIKVLRKIENWLGFKLQLEVSVGLGVSLSFAFGVDQHEELIEATGTLSIKPSFSIYLVVAASNAECRAGGSIEGNVSINAQAPDPGFFMKLGSSGALTGKLSVSGKLKGRVLWIGPEYDIGGSKTFEIFKWEMWTSEPRSMLPYGTKKP